MNDEVKFDTALRDALRWTVANLKQFDPFDGGEPFTIRKGQCASELAVATYCYVTLTGDRTGDAVVQISSVLERLQETDEFSDRLMRSPAEFTLFCYVYACLRRLGMDSSTHRDLIRRALEAGFLEQVERLPYRMMDVRLSLEWAELPHSGLTWEQLFHNSILAQDLQAVHVNEEVAYALTHALFFYYSFGTRPVVEGPAVDPRWLRALLSSLLVTYCQEAHWDLVGELLVCWESVGLPTTTVCERAWDAFLGQQGSDGAFPGPARNNDRDQAGDGTAEDASRIRFAHRYHTTLVAVIALACRRAAKVGIAAGVSNERSGVSGDDRWDGAREGTTVPLARALSRSGVWFETVLSEMEQQGAAPPDALCRVVVGSWMCDAIARPDMRQSPTVASRVAVAAMSSDGQTSWSEAPPTLRLLAAGLLSTQGQHVPALDAFLDRTVAALGALGATDPVEDLELVEKRLLLRALGLHGAPAQLDVSHVLAAGRALNLDDPGPGITDLLLRIESSTACGLHPRTLEPDDWWLAEMLAGLAVRSFRRYDLLGGCRPLRALCHLVPPGHGLVAECSRYLAFHQRPTGEFGYFGSEVAQLKRELGDRFSARTQLYLPVSLECVWTLGECLGQGWTLYSALAESTARKARASGEHA